MRGHPGERELGLLPQWHPEHVTAAGVTYRPAFGAQRQQGAVHAQTEPDAGEILAAELGHQPVVTPTAADTGLRAQSIVDELEGGLGVVVQSAHQSRVDDIRHAQGVKVGPHSVEMEPGGIREVIQHQRCVGGQFAYLRPFVIKHPKRVEGCACPGGLVEFEAKQELLQQLPVLCPTGVIPERGDLQSKAVQAQRAETGIGDRDDLGVQGRVVDTDRLDADLLQLAITTGLGAFVSEERPCVAELDR